jgi:hypothetical protein
MYFPCCILPVFPLFFTCIFLVVLTFISLESSQSAFYLYFPCCFLPVFPLLFFTLVKNRLAGLKGNTGKNNKGNTGKKQQGKYR